MTSAELRDVATVSALLLPLLLAAAIPAPRLRPLALVGAPWAALPALALALAPSHREALKLDAMLLGMRLGVDDGVTRGLLLVTAALWLASGLYARAYFKAAPDQVRIAPGAGSLFSNGGVPRAPDRGRFWVHFLGACCGNIGLIVARDVASFYTFYALMTFAAYGTIVYDRTDEALRAGRVYIVMALLGEVLLMTAFIAIVGAEIDLDLSDVPREVGSSPLRELIVGLLLAGFGVKAGALFLHVWLPLAHPVAPTPASAVLSGAMIKAGLLGWLRFLPLGAVEMPDAGLLVLAVGFSAAFYGIGVGLAQSEPKTILAYSSISQMGFMTAAVGLGLASRDATSAAISAVLFYAVHHALAKGALFLGVGVAHASGSRLSSRIVRLGLLWPALDLAGAPLSSGALAKFSLKELVLRAPWDHALLSLLLSVGAVGSTMLMAHFLRRAAPRASAERGGPSPGLWVPWALLLVFDFGLLLRPPADAPELGLLFEPRNLWTAVWPVFVGVALVSIGWRLERRGMRLHVPIPPGDVLVLFENRSAFFRSIFARVASVPRRFRRRCGRAAFELAERGLAALSGLAERAEARLVRFGTAGLLFSLVLFTLLAMAMGAAR